MFKGCDRAILGESIRDTVHHGNDGLGGVPDVEPRAPGLDLLKPGHAANVLVQLANDNQGE